MTAMEEALGDAYTEPAADVRGYIDYVRSRAERPVIRVCVAGITGWTGRAVAEAVESADDLELVFGVARSDPDRFSTVVEALDAVEADVLVDYTHATVVARTSAPRSRAAWASSSARAGSRLRLRADRRAARAQGVGVVAAGNFSLSAALVLRFAVEAAPHLERGRWSTTRARPSRMRRAGRRGELAERLEEVRRRSSCPARVGARRPGGSRRDDRRNAGALAAPSGLRRVDGGPSSPARASGSRSATTRATAPRRTSPGRCSRSAPCPGSSG